LEANLITTLEIEKISILNTNFTQQRYYPLFEKQMIKIKVQKNGWNDGVREKNQSTPINFSL